MDALQAGVTTTRTTTTPRGAAVMTRTATPPTRAGATTNSQGVCKLLWSLTPIVCWSDERDFDCRGAVRSSRAHTWHPALEMKSAFWSPSLHRACADTTGHTSKRGTMRSKGRAGTPTKATATMTRGTMVAAMGRTSTALASRSSTMTKAKATNRTAPTTTTTATTTTSRSVESRSLAALFPVAFRHSFRPVCCCSSVLRLRNGVFALILGVRARRLGCILSV